MSTYITLGADKFGQVYGLELDGDGKSWRRNPLGYSTSCHVIRPVDRRTYEYVTEDPESVEDLWKAAVAAGQTQKGLDDWFDEIDAEGLMDKSFVYELLEDDGNPTVSYHNLSIRKRMDEDEETDESSYIVSSDGIWDENGQPMSFQRSVELALVESNDVTSVESDDDVFTWEAAGWWSPEEPFVVEFAPHELIEEYYRHLETCEWCKFRRSKEEEK